MRERWVLLGVLAAIAGTVVATVAQAGPRSERVTLAANEARVTATAEIEPGSLRLVVDGVRPGARVDAAIDVLACAQSGYERHAVGGAVADGSGRAEWRVTGALERRARDGRHVIAVGAGGRTIACGSIPVPEGARGESPSRHWGIRTFGRFID